MQGRRLLRLRLHPDVTNRFTGAGPLPLPTVLAWALAWTLASLSTGARAEQTYYRWIDERGNLVMSDRPPERSDIAYETVAMQGSLRRPSARPAPSPAAANGSPGTASASRQGEDTKDPAPQVAAVERDPELCAQARENLEVLAMKPRIRIYNEQGELEYLTPEQIEEEKQRTRLTIESHCGR